MKYQGTIFAAAMLLCGADVQAAPRCLDFMEQQTWSGSGQGIHVVKHGYNLLGEPVYETVTGPWACELKSGYLNGNLLGYTAKCTAIRLEARQPHHSAYTIHWNMTHDGTFVGKADDRRLYVKGSSETNSVHCKIVLTRSRAAFVLPDGTGASHKVGRGPYTVAHIGNRKARLALPLHDESGAFLRWMTLELTREGYTSPLHGG